MLDWYQSGKLALLLTKWSPFYSVRQVRGMSINAVICSGLWRISCFWTIQLLFNVVSLQSALCDILQCLICEYVRETLPAGACNAAVSLSCQNSQIICNGFRLFVGISAQVQQRIDRIGVLWVGQSTGFYHVMSVFSYHCTSEGAWNGLKRPEIWCPCHFRALRVVEFIEGATFSSQKHGTNGAVLPGHCWGIIWSITTAVYDIWVCLSFR